MKTIVILATAAIVSLSSTVNAQQLRAGVGDPLAQVVGNLVLDMNPLADKCYDIVDGVKVEVPCPDVIVAKPDAGQRQDSTTIASMFASRAIAPRAAVSNLAAEVPVDEGTYNCYNERPPNSGNFVRVRCPDIIVLDTSN